MKFSLKTFFFFPALALLLLASCKGPEGPTGPAGPAGAVGAKGDKGDTGADGSVTIASRIITLSASDFANVSETLESVTYPANEITAAIAERGTVLGYTDIGTGINAWIPLPYHIQGVELTYAYGEGAILMLLVRPSNFSPVADAFDGDRVKFVFLPPEEMEKLDGIPTEDYTAVMDALGLNP